MGKTGWDKYYENLKKDLKTKVELERAGRAIDIAMQIYDLRRKRGLTQKELANIVGVKQSNIARLEDTDYRGYSLRTLEKIAVALRTKLEVFLAPEEASVFSPDQNFIVFAGAKGPLSVSYFTNNPTDKESILIPPTKTYENAVIRNERLPEKQYFWNIL